MNLTQEFSKVKKASRALGLVSEEKKNKVLRGLAAALLKRGAEILAANQIDCEKMGEADPSYDRLLLTEDRLSAMAKDLENVANLSAGLGEVLEQRTMPNGLELKKIRVPLGVIGVIFEARPNVTVDVFSICFKAGNACILKAGSDAQNSAVVLVRIIREVLREQGLDEDLVFLMPPEREGVAELLKAREFVDVIIPRGGKGLIDFVVENSTVPVIETGAGIVHTYVDSEVDLEKAAAIIFNAKTRRPSVCNALDTLLVHKNRLEDLEGLVAKLAEKQVEIFADEAAYKALEGEYLNLQHATEDHFGTEFLSLKMSVKTVSSVEEAVGHIGKFGSKHSEAILSTNAEAIEYFLNHVDAAAVYANTSTAFTDGGQFGLGAEIGISTQKLHARGPMALEEMTSTKWLVRGDGQVRA